MIYRTTVEADPTQNQAHGFDSEKISVQYHEYAKYFDTEKKQRERDREINIRNRYIIF